MTGQRSGAAETFEKRTHIIQGEFIVVDDPDACVTTVLGSCVAACMRDPFAGVGGMNHFLLPGPAECDDAGAAERVGLHLMELLVNGLLKVGARRECLEAKVFGGAKPVRGLSDIGLRNVGFAERFLCNEGIRYVGGSTGGKTGRRIEYWPVSGRARQVYLQQQDVFQHAPNKISAPAVVSAGDLELF
ncbi:MAG: chemotaxis protein CheD [Hyphomicrobium sp.]|nr:chemotaxis protein CheD [Hyphomicrobium sp.]